MIRQEEIRTESGRCVGGTFLRVTHIPSGVTRHQTPLAGESGRVVKARLLREIEAELAARGLTQYLVPACRLKPREV